MLANFSHVHGPGEFLELGKADTEKTLQRDDRRAALRDVRLRDRVEEHIQNAVHDAVLLGVLHVVRCLDRVAEQGLAPGQSVD